MVGTPGLLPILVATVIAFVVGYGVIIWFLKLVSTRSYLPFVIYRLVLAVVVVAGLLFGSVPQEVLRRTKRPLLLVPVENH